MIEKISSMLKLLNIEVFDHFYVDDEEDVYIFLVRKMILQYNVKKNIISLSFYVTAEPEYVSFVVLGLKKLESEGIKVYVIESFMYDSKGCFVNGEKAYEKFEEEKNESIISEFVEHQKQLHFLASVKGFQA